MDRYATTSVWSWPSAGGDWPSDDLCMWSVLLFCWPHRPPDGLGPAMVSDVRRRLTVPANPVSGSGAIGDRRDDRPCRSGYRGSALTCLAVDPRQAFHDTNFTIPTVNIQPEGDVTLVNLPTYFEVRFPKAGFGPDEVDTPDPARLLGYHIQVRPRLKAVTYHLGTTTGRADDLAGRAAPIRRHPRHLHPARYPPGKGRHRLHRAVPGGPRPVVRHAGRGRPRGHSRHPHRARGQVPALHPLRSTASDTRHQHLTRGRCRARSTRPLGGPARSGFDRQAPLARGGRGEGWLVAVLAAGVGPQGISGA